jgi:hypothetical protein
MQKRKMMNLKLRWAFGIAIFLTAVSSIFISHKMVVPIKKLKDHLFAFSLRRQKSRIKLLLHSPQRMESIVIFLQSRVLREWVFLTHQVRIFPKVGSVIDGPYP